MKFVRLLGVVLLLNGSIAFTPTRIQLPTGTKPLFQLQVERSNCSGSMSSTGRMSGNHQRMTYPDNLVRQAAAFWLVASLVTPATSLASEIGKEVEAPTFYTGETVEICTKRGPLGACLQTETRTAANDNDKAEKYFKGGILSQKEQLAQLKQSESGNALIEKLRQQTEDNREKNELIVAQRTFENDASATFGPFDKQVLLMNTDGKTFTLLSNPQAMRLKKAGFIEGRRFIKQPTEQELEDAASPDELPAFLKAIMGQ